MARKTVKVDRGVQFDLLSGGPASDTRKSTSTAASGRVFNVPERTELFFGTVRVDRYLEQAGLTMPLSVAELLDQYDWSEFESRYAASGRAPYSPKAMAGLILYGVMQGISSLRALERLARQDLGCIWITGGICPDHACIGRFIVLHDSSFSGELFEQITRSALRNSGSDARRLAGDGTLVEAACSHYGLLHEEAIRANVESKKKALDKEPGNKQREQQLALAEQVEHTFDQRHQIRTIKGSRTETLVVSPVEPDAMVQPQKRKRGKAASYKPSVLCNDKRVIVAHDVDPSHESSLLAGLLDQSQQVSGDSIETLLLDGGYFCDSVLTLALERDINLLCSSGKQAQETKAGAKYAKSLFHYNEYDDVYVCPAGQLLKPGPQGQKTYKMYRSSACKKCSLREQCTSAQAGRRIRRLEGDEIKEAMRVVMQHPQARKELRQRQVWVEPAFGYLQSVQCLKRFKRRGLPGVKREFSLHTLAYNLRIAAVGFLRLIIGLNRRYHAKMRLFHRIVCTILGKKQRSFALANPLGAPC